MFHLKSAQGIINILTSLFAYVAIIVPSGWFRAWVAKKMGDDTAQDLGFLTLNPMAHIDFFGVLFLLWMGYGWGRYIPINPHNIVGKYRYIKIGTAMFSDTFARIVMAIVALVTIVALFGASQSIGMQGAHVSSFTLSLGRILSVGMRLAVLLATINLIINVVGLFFMMQSPNMMQMPQFSFYYLIAAFVVLWIFGNQVSYLLFNGINMAATVIAQLLGILK